MNIVQLVTGSLTEKADKALDRWQRHLKNCEFCRKYMLVVLEDDCDEQLTKFALNRIRSMWKCACDDTHA